MKYYKKSIERRLILFNRTLDSLVNNYTETLSEKFIKHFNEIYKDITEGAELSNKVIKLNEDIFKEYIQIVNEVNTKEKENIIKEKCHFFVEWSKKIAEALRYRVVIVGVNELTLSLLDVIDPTKAEVVTILDDTNKYTGQFLGEYVIQPLAVLDHQAIDYIIIATEVQTTLNYLLNTSELKVRLVDYRNFVSFTHVSPEFYVKMLDLIESSFDKIEGALTGLSYIQKGVDEKYLKKPFINLANPSQDLYYDFLMFKYFYENRLNKEKLSYVIIGLSYYSLQYDLSLSKESMARSNYYYPLVKSFHNAPEQERYLSVHKSIEQIDIFVENHFIYNFKNYKEHYEDIIRKGHAKEFNLTIMSDEEILASINSAKKNYNKNYPETVTENKVILKEYLTYLRKHNIKPIIIVCPMTKLYQAFTPKRFQEELYGALEELKVEGFEFQFLDYYYSNEFEDKHFYDCSHINKTGSQKLSEMLNRDIDW